MYDAIVVGGGIVGSAVGYHLARAGADALLVDREDTGRATDAGAGIVSPATSSRTESDTWFRFAVDAVNYYPTLADRLADEQDGDVGYSQPGLLAVAGVDDEDAFEAALARIEDRQAELGHPEPGTVEEIAPGEAQSLFPPLALPERVFHYSEAGRVTGRTFAGALQRAGEGHGLTVRDGNVGELRTEGGAVAGVVADGEDVDAEAVVVAGGAWSNAFGDDLGVDVPIDPQRGQILHLETTEATDEWPIVSVLGGKYFVPWPGGEVAVGATRETGSGFDPRVTAAGAHEVLDDALAAAPGLADAELREAKVGLRPVARDGLPVLGGVPDVEGAYLATGHGATGLQLGPYSGKLVAQAVLGEEPDTDISHLGVGRFN